MPVETTYNPLKARFEIDVSQRLDASGIAFGLETVLSHPEWKEGKPRLIRIARDTDLSGLTLEAYERDVVPVLDRHKDKLKSRPKAAIVCPNYAHEVVMWLYENVPAIRQSSEFKVFPTEADAELFLSEHGALSASK